MKQRSVCSKLLKSEKKLMHERKDLKKHSENQLHGTPSYFMIFWALSFLPLVVHHTTSTIHSSLGGQHQHLILLVN